MSRSDRYARQRVLPEIGNKGQEGLRGATVAVVGVGALGSVAAELLVRSGVGEVRLIDRDCVELSNLQRQALFDEEDARVGREKAIAAAERLSRINSEPRILPLVTELTVKNGEALLDGADLVLDGTDNFVTRYAINALCLRLGIPWVHGAVTGTQGVVLPVGAEGKPCFRCFQPAAAGIEGDGCAVAGVLSATTHIVASQQVAQGMRLLLGETAPGTVFLLDPWQGQFVTMELAPEPSCPNCGDRASAAGSSTGPPGRSGLEDARLPEVEELCGDGTIRIRPAQQRSLDLTRLYEGVPADGSLGMLDDCIRFRVGEATVTLFRDGRAHIRGASSKEQAKQLYREYTGG